jgi:hypothetical protein
MTGLFEDAGGKGLLRALGSLFVVPAEDALGPEVVRRPPAVAVVCSAGDAVTVGSALALAVAGERRAPCVLVAAWTGGAPQPHGFAAPWVGPGRRLAANLAARGQDARASGRLVHVALPAGEVEAVAAAERAIAAAGTAPTVLAVGGARTDAFDRLLAEQDVVLVATAPNADPELAALAAAAVPLPGHAVASCSLAPAAPTRALARAGLTLSPSLRAALRPALEALA